MRFGPASYIMAKDGDENIRLLVMEHKKNKKKFYGVFVVTKNSPINSINELKGKSFAFGNKNSTIGRYLSQAELVKAGIRSADLSKYDFLGRHDKVALAVAVGNYDAGVVKENTFKKYAESKVCYSAAGPFRTERQKDIKSLKTRWFSRCKRQRL